MADQEQSLTVKITADAGSATSGIEELQQNLEKIVDVQAQLGDAADKAATAQEQGAQRATAAEQRAAQAQQAIIDQLQGRFSSAAMDRAAMAEAVSNMETALRIRQLEHETQMGRQSLEDQKARLEQLAAATEASSAARIAAERAVQDVNARMVQQTIAEMREEVAQGKTSAEAQVAALQSIAAESEYALNVRKLAAEELARIETADAREAAQAVAEAEKRKAQEAKEAALQIRESHREAQEFSYVAMDIGYMLPGANELANAAYLMRDLSTATGDMLLKVGLLAGAFAAVAGGVDYLSHAVDDAGKMQEEMASLGVAVHNQGGDWGAARQGVEAWATSLQHATTYSRSEAITAVNDLVTAGTKLGDAEKLVGVATDVAAGSHRKLADVVNLVKEAEAGRGQGLVRLDEHLKTIIHSHGTLQQVVDQLEHDFSGEAADATGTYEGKQAQLKNTLGTLSEKIGNDLLPVMTDLESATLRMVDGIDTELPKAEQAWHGLQSAISGAIGWIHDHKAAEEVAGLTAGIIVMRGAIDVFATSTLPAFGRAIGIAFATAEAGVTSFLASIGPVGWTILAIGAAVTIFAEAWSHDWGHVQEVTEGAVNGIVHGLGELLVKLSETENKMAGLAQNAPILGDTLARNLREMANAAYLEGGDLEHAQIRLTASPTYGPPASMQGGVGAAQHLSTDLHLSDNPVMGNAKGAGTGAGHVAGEVSDREYSFDPTFGDLGSKTDAVRQQIDALKEKEAQLQHELKMTTTQAQYNATAHKNQAEMIAAYGAEVAKVRALVASESAEEKSSEAEVLRLHQAYETARANLQGVTHLSAQQTQHLKELQNAERDSDQAFKLADASLKTLHSSLDQHRSDLREVIDAWNKLRYAAEETTSDLTRKWNDFLAKERTAAVESSISLRGTWQQQATYYYQMMQQIVATDDQSLQEKESYYQKYLDTVKSGLDKARQEHEKYITDLQTKEEGWINDLVSKHESLRNSLKTIWDGIVSDFSKNIEQMIVKSSLFTNLNQSIFGLFGNGQGQGFGGAQGGGALALSGLLAMGSPAAAAVPGGTAIGTASNPAYIRHTDDDIQRLTGSPNGLSTAVTDGSGLPVNIAGITNPGASVSYQDAQGNTYTTGASGSGQSFLSGAISGVGLGMTTASMGDSLLGIPSNSATTGDSAIGAAIGAGAGAIFGHNPIAEAVGGSIGGFLGSLFGPKETQADQPNIYDPTYQQLVADLAGTQQNMNGTWVQPETAYSTYAGNTNLSTDLYNELQNVNTSGLNPAQLADVQQLMALAGNNPNGLEVANEKNGVATLDSGQTISVSNLESLIEQSQQFLGTGSSTFTISRTYPTAGSPSTDTVGPTGNYTPVPANVNVTVQGSVVGATGVDEVALIIAQRQYDIQKGLAPGGYGVRKTLQNQGNF